MTVHYMRGSTNWENWKRNLHHWAWKVKNRAFILRIGHTYRCRVKGSRWTVTGRYEHELPDDMDSRVGIRLEKGREVFGWRDWLDTGEQFVSTYLFDRFYDITK